MESLEINARVIYSQKPHLDDPHDHTHTPVGCGDATAFVTLVHHPHVAVKYSRGSLGFLTTMV